MNQQLSHNKTRAFQANYLHAPRDFIKQDWQWLVDSEQSVVLEIGAGKGKHAIQFACDNPNTRIIAIERTANKFQDFAKSVKQYQQNAQQLDNLYPVHADAIAWTVFALPAQSLSQIFLLYPNPEPHNRNQQWLNMPYFEFLLSRLQAGGTITLASNIIDYLDHAEQQAVDVWRLPTARTEIDADSQRTHFEIKYLARGESCQQLVMTKPNGYVTRFDYK